MGTRVSPGLLKGKMFFLLDRPAGGDVVPPVPRCNAYGLQGTKFLDPPPVPKQ